MKEEIPKLYIIIVLIINKTFCSEYIEISMTQQTGIYNFKLIIGQSKRKKTFEPNMNQNSLFITMKPFDSNDKSIKLEKEEEEFAIEGQLMAGEKFISNFYFKEKNPFLSQRRNNFI